MQKCPEIKTRIKYYNLKIDGNKIVKLVYNIQQYKYIKDQSKKNINNLKNGGVQIENIKINNNYYYYQKYAEKKYDAHKRKKIVDAILRIKLSSGKTLENEISEYHDNFGVKKTAKDNLFSTKYLILDILSTYLILEDDPDGLIILDNNDFKKIHSKECEFRDENIYYKSKDSKQKRNNEMQLKNWAKSKTYRMNQIFSYDYTKENKEHNTYNNNTLQIGENKKNYCRNGIIDKYDEYISKWESVDVDGFFEYNNFLFQIINYDPYKKRKAFSRDYNKDEYDMDKILVFEQYGNLYFFDMDIYQIDNKYIKKC